MPQHKTEYVEIKVKVAIVPALYPYLTAEAKRRRLTIDALTSQILNEDLARKRAQSRTKDVKLPSVRAFTAKL